MTDPTNTEIEPGLHCCMRGRQTSIRQKYISAMLHVEDRTTRHATTEGGTLDPQASYAVTTWLNGQDDGS